MGLTFQKLGAVKFGDFTAQPKGTTELKLRLQKALSDTEKEDGLATVAELLPQFFPDSQEKVKEFIDADMTVDGMATLAAYLIGGDDAVARVNNAIANGGENE